MHRRAFTFIEIMTVVLILGLLAGAVAWSLVEDVRRSKRETVVRQITHYAHLTRLAAQRLGTPLFLRIDLDQESLRRVAQQNRAAAPPGHTLTLPPGFRIDHAFAPGTNPLLDTGSHAPVAQSVQTGIINIPFSTQGLSPAFALHLAWDAVGPEDAAAPQEDDPAFRGRGVWLLFAGLSGQVTCLHEDQEIHNLFARLATGGTDAH